MHKSLFKQPFFYTSLLSLIVFGLIISSYYFGGKTSPYAFGWTTPSTTPPGGNITGGGTPAGSTGYVQFNNAGAFGGDANLFWDNINKRLGIGTTTPEAKLDVQGNVKTYSAIGAGDNVRTGLGHYDTSAQVAGVGGQLVLGYKYTDAGVYTEGAIIKMYKLNSTTGDHSSGLKFQVRNTGANLSTKMVLDPSGNVGIGTATPVGKLNIQGAAATSQWIVRGASSDAITRVGLYITSANNSEIYGYNASGNLNVYLNTAGNSYLNGGNVGIGTTTPAYKLDVVGDVRLSGNLIATANTLDSCAWTSYTCDASQTCASPKVVAGVERYTTGALCGTAPTQWYQMRLYCCNL